MSTVSSTKHSSTPTRSHSTSTTRKKSTSSAVRQSSAGTHKTRDNVKLSKDSGTQPHQASLPNFSSWATPSAPGQDSQLKPLSGSTLARKARGESVSSLQKHLNGAGAKLDVDGKFGPLTQKAVRKFQKQNHLTVDGIVGPETMGALNKGLKPDQAPKGDKPKAEAEAPKVDKSQAAPPKADAQKGEAPKVDKPKPKAEAEAPKGEAPKVDNSKSEAPKVDSSKVEGAKKAQGLPQLAGSKMTPQEKYDHYAAMVKAAGGKMDGNKPTVLGLRGLGTDGKRHDSGKNTGSGDDTFVVLGHDKKGNPTVTELKGATHAATSHGHISGGVAQLRPGNYDVNRRHDYHGREAWAVNGGSNVPVYRDRNRDGNISDSEKAYAVAHNTQGDGILFHRDRGTSIGCQVLPDNVLGHLKNAVGGGNFRYTLIDANRPQ